MLPRILHHHAMAPKKDKSTKEKIPADEKYDWTRTQGPDKEDPRCLGPPCFGEHQEALPGRGSVTGSNKFARWTGCQACGIRLSYTPSWGSHGLSRQAGPLHQDTSKQLEEKKPAKGSIDLVNKKIGYDAQERSIMNQLEMVQKKKEQWLKIQASKGEAIKENDQEKGHGKGYTVPKEKMDYALMDHQQKASGTMSSGPISQIGTTLTDKEVMSQTPGRKARKPEESAEHLEYNHRNGESPESEEWSMVAGQPSTSP